MHHVKSKASPMNQYYTNLFRTAGVYCFRVREIQEEAQIFNSLFLKDINYVEIIIYIYFLVDKLSFFLVSSVQSILHSKFEVVDVLCGERVKRVNNLDRFGDNNKLKTCIQRKSQEINWIIIMDFPVFIMMYYIHILFGDGGYIQ